MRFTKGVFNFLAGIVLLAFLLLPPLPALATILFAGGEDLDYVITGPYVVSTNTTFFRSAYAREGVSPNSAATIMLAPQFSNTSSLWLHAQAYGGGTQTGANTEWAGFYGSDGVKRIVVRSTGSNSQVKLSKVDGSGSYTDLATCTAAFPLNAVTKFDWFINYAVSGATTLYIAGTSLCTFSGDVTTNSITSLRQMFLSTGTGNAASYWSEVIVSTTDTRDMSLFTCQPVANGTNQSWTGTASNINATSINDVNSITTGSSNVVGEFTCPTLVAGTFTVPAVVQSVRTQIGTSGPQNFRYIARPAGAGADFDNGSDVPGTAVFSNTNNIWSTNPNTSAAWATGDLGAGVNFGLKSRP